MRQHLQTASGKGARPARTLSLAALALAAAAVLIGQATGGRAAVRYASAAGPIVIAITEEGMTPAQATASAGLVHLRVENRRAEAGALTIRVVRQDGAPVRDIRLPENTREAATELDLAAGTYTLSEAAHPSWTCSLTVQ